MAPKLEILPWNGHRAALSLTYDDGLTAHLDAMAPELDRHGLTATFYVPTGNLQRPEAWRELHSRGHEIGNHSRDHKHAEGLTPEEEHSQVMGAKEHLEKAVGVPIHSFAYPYTEVTPTLKRCAASGHSFSRGGSRGSFYMEPQMEPDWNDLPSQVAYSEMGPEVYENWMDETLRRGSWTILQLHGLEGAGPGWQPMPRATYSRLLKDLASRQPDLWIAPLAQVGAYWRAQKIVEKTLAASTGPTVTWERPSLFPKGLVLKAKLGQELLDIPFDRGIFNIH